MIPLRDSTRSETFPILTISLIALNVCIFIFQLSLGPDGMEEFINVWGLVPAHDLSGSDLLISFTPFLTYMFLHISWMHLIGNMWILWLFGDNLEDQMGRGRFLVFYILCGTIAGLAHGMVFPHSEVPVIGASGAVAGVMGAYFVLFTQARILTYIPPIFLIRVPAWVYLGFWVMVQIGGVTSGIINPDEYSSVAFWAHIGGFIAGFILYRFFLKPKDEDYYFS
jgi:membrane associated rhomboid family serine protease